MASWYFVPTILLTLWRFRNEDLFCGNYSCEREIIDLGIRYRLKSYHYRDQLLNTMKVVNEGFFHSSKTEVGKKSTTIFRDKESTQA